jgi:hypothetical protein
MDADHGIGRDDGRRLPFPVEQLVAYEAGWEWAARVFHQGSEGPDYAHAEAFIQSCEAGSDLQYAEPAKDSLHGAVLEALGLDRFQPDDPVSEAFFEGAIDSWYEHVTYDPGDQ